MAWAGRAHHDAADSLAPVFYRVWIDRITGHTAAPSAPETIAAPVVVVPPPPVTTSENRIPRGLLKDNHDRDTWDGTQAAGAIP